MTAAYFLTPLAEGDLDDTWDYVADRFGFDVSEMTAEIWEPFTMALPGSSTSL